MTLAWQDRQASVALLRIKPGELDPQVAKLRAANAITVLSLQPSSLPADAILCIRSLRDPKPGSLSLGCPGTIDSRVWEQAVNASIDQLARQAARPADGAVPANAEAVVFLDRAEWLACLAVDWCAGDMVTRWWWRSLIRNRGVAGAVFEAWLQSPECTPAALHRLAIQHQAVPFVQKLSEAQARELALAVMRTFGLHRLQGVLQEYWMPGASSRLQGGGLPVAGAPGGSDHPPPWQALLSKDSFAALPVDHQLFVGVGVALHRAPHSVRSARFAEQLRAWITAASPTQTGACDVKSVRKVSTHGEPESEEKTFPGLDIPYFQQQEKLPTGISSASSGEPSPRNAPADAVPEVASPAASTIIPLEAADFSLKLSKRVDTIEITTDYGGSLYLINLGIYLGLYADFTSPLTPGIDLSIWDFVALVSTELIGEEVAADPLWSLLARLAGRLADDPPGVGFQPPGGASLPDWLDDLMGTIRQRLRLALSADNDALPGFFRAQARLQVTATRLDAWLSLDELPIEIRLSGLDRDPGWVPAAGRTIAFQFD